MNAVDWINNPTKVCVKTLALAVLEAAELREASWDKGQYEADKADRLRNLPYGTPSWHISACPPDADEYYSKTLRQACDEAANKHGLEGAGGLIYTALLSWNDALDWATRVVEGA